MAFFPNSIGLNSFLHIFGSLSLKIIVVLAEYQYLGRFKALKILKICQINYIKRSKISNFI